MATGPTSSGASGAGAPEDQVRLRADCGRCAGLCCVAPAFTASADFASSKDAGTPCPNLTPQFRCGIHRELRPRGFPGCGVYDCLGAGQHVTQVVFPGVDWRSGPQQAASMFTVFGVVRELHEFLWYLGQALGLPVSGPSLERVRALRSKIEQATRTSSRELEALDPAGWRAEVGALLVEVSAEVRGVAAEGQVKKGPGPGPKPPRARLRPGADLQGVSLRGADLVGVRLDGANLRRVDLRAAYLIGADLSGADLRQADLLGADLRAADLSGADASSTLFLTQMQVNAARGDGSTRIPADVDRPPSWTARA